MTTATHARGRFNPLPANHPAVGDACAACGNPLEAGQRPALINPRPADEEEAIKARGGQAYTAQVDIAHEDCCDNFEQ